MEIKVPPEQNDDAHLREEAARRERAEDNLWATLGMLFRWRRFILGVTGGMAVVAVVVSLLLPDWYLASSRLLLPEGNSGGLSSALLGDLSSAAASLLGGGGGDYSRYLAILSSRSMYKSLVDSFELIHVYEDEDSETPLKDAIETLSDNVEFVIDDEYEFLSVEVYDKDPRRAAAMANFFVRRLDEINNRLSAQTAGLFRAYVERRYGEAQHTRSTLLDSLQAFQQHYGVFDMEAQTQAYFTQLAEMRANTLQLEIQHEALRDQLGPNNPQVRNLDDLIRAANGKYQDALNGREQVLPISRKDAPAAFRHYLDFMLDKTIQEKTLEIIAPLLEQSRFEEQRQSEAVQVLDPAVPPVLKAKPRRSIICIVATLSAFILAVVFVLVYEWWRRNHAAFADRLRTAAEAPSSGSA